LVDLKENAASAYRRGSVLGFTIGEVFILLSFILLLILLLKQAEVFEKQEQVNALDEQLIYATSRLAQTEDTLQLVQARLLEAERRLEEAQVRNEQLASSVATWTEFTAAEREKIQELIASGELYSATAIASALEDMTNSELGNVIDQATQPGRQELLNALSEVSDEAMLNLAKAFEAVERPEDLASNVGEFGGVDPFTLTRGVTIARSIQELDPRISEDDVSEAIEVGTTINDNLSPSDWQRLETLLEATGWSPQTLEQAYAIVQALNDDTEASLAAQVGAALEEAAQRTLTLASSLDDALGDVVESRGGLIDSRGTISFSDATLFPRGRADLTSEMRTFLDELCLPWLSTLRDQGFEIEEIRIEGHASPGWRGARNEQDAYLRNLELSQARARVVLEYCIDTTWGQNLGQWARERSVAIGFSSSRPVFENGEVSLERSQRVLLSAAPDISDIMQEIEETVSQ
jgi:flagellar motor protein MotB